MKKIRKRKYTKEVLERAVEGCISINDVLRNLGISTKSGGNSSHISKRLKEYGIDTSYFIGQAHWKGRKLPYKMPKIPLSKILIERSDYSRSHLKQRLLEKGILINRCEICGIDGEWRGKVLNMVLDHINGVNNDNRRFNLRMLCPNCNSQQPTFCGKNTLPKNRCSICGVFIGRKSSTCIKHRPPPTKGKILLSKRKVERPLLDILEKEISKMGYSAVGRKYGVSDNAIRKWVQ